MTVIKTTKLQAMPTAQAKIYHYDNGDIVLCSYSTLVCMIDSDGWLSCNGLYSMTTRKHISAFMKEYAAPLDYYTAKRMYETDCQINIHTGEVVNNKELRRG